MLTRTTLLFSLVLVVSVAGLNNSYAQDKWWKEKKYKNESTRVKYELCRKTFKDIGYGFSYRNINFINPYFDTQVYLNVLGNEKGYYSFGQAELILQDFMEYFTLENFKYLRSSKFKTYAFVNGVYTYMIGAGKQNLRVTISLKYKDNTWYIDQITIN
jgi:Domain of unknown function (DUF4783)